MMASSCVPFVLNSIPRTTSRIPHLLSAINSKHALRYARLPPNPIPSPRHASTLPKIRSLPIRSPADPKPTSEGRSVSGYIWAIGLFGALSGTYLSYYYASWRASIKKAESLHLEQNADVSNRWDDISRDFDEEIEFSEKAMFMGRKRRRLLGGGLVQGKVLEVSCGTGRNFQWYDFERDENRIEELVFNDQSAVQLGIARQKWEDLQAERRKNPKRKGRAFDGPVKWVVGDSGVKGVVRRPEGGFDTIVQTMGVCSMADPMGFLRHLNYLVRQPGEGRGKDDPSDQGGRILLLEHGRGYYDWINRLLDSGATMHADRYGCWYNKDVGEVVRQSGLRVEMVKRYHLGTTWEVVLRPEPVMLRYEDQKEVAIVVADDVVGDRSKKSTSWWPR